MLVLEGYGETKTSVKYRYKVQPIYKNKLIDKISVRDFGMRQKVGDIVGCRKGICSKIISYVGKIISKTESSIV